MSGNSRDQATGYGRYVSATRSTFQAGLDELEALLHEQGDVVLKMLGEAAHALAAQDEAVREQQTPVAYLAALLEAEMTERAERRCRDAAILHGVRRQILKGPRRR